MAQQPRRPELAISGDKATFALKKRNRVKMEALITRAAMALSKFPTSGIANDNGELKPFEDLTPEERNDMVDASIIKHLQTVIQNDAEHALRDRRQALINDELADVLFAGDD